MELIFRFPNLLPNGSKLAEALTGFAEHGSDPSYYLLPRQRSTPLAKAYMLPCVLQDHNYGTPFKPAYKPSPSVPRSTLFQNKLPTPLTSPRGPPSPVKPRQNGAHLATPLLSFMPHPKGIFGIDSPPRTKFTSPGRHDTDDEVCDH